jgi:aerobic carbon-monoxide dehydrogenase medium subunit
MHLHTIAAMSAEVLVPNSAGEAVSLYGDGADVTIFGGGTILMPELAAGRLTPKRALLLHKSKLDEIRVEDSLVRIGAMVTLATLSTGPEELLARCALHIADNEVRGSATVGGNICAPPGRDAQRGDLGAALIALGARVHSTGAGGERTDPVEDFLAGDRAGRLVLAVEIDRISRSSAFESLRRRHAHSFAVATVAACSSERDGLRIGVSGAGATAVRCRTVEASRDPADVLEDVQALDDAVAPRSYREKMLPILVRRALDGVKA